LLSSRKAQVHQKTYFVTKTCCIFYVTGLDGSSLIESSNLSSCIFILLWLVFIVSPHEFQELVVTFKDARVHKK
jgi:hypothetical protein